MSKKTYPLLYAAYGANTNRAHMARRCPTGRYVGNAVIEGYRLIFRSVADVIPVAGQSTVVAMWEIMPADERALDQFEGYPSYYTKHYARIRFRGKNRLMMFYIMTGNRHDRHEPPYGYEHTLREGYAQCGMDPTQIDAAIRDARNSERRQQRYSGSWLSPAERKAKQEKTDYARLMQRTGSRPAPPSPMPRTQGALWHFGDDDQDDQLDAQYEEHSSRLDRLRGIFPEYPDWFLSETGYFDGFK